MFDRVVSVPHHIETSQLTCRANQLNGFYMTENIGCSWVENFLVNSCQQQWRRVLLKKNSHNCGKALDCKHCNFARRFHRRCFPGNFAKFFKVASTLSNSPQLLKSIDWFLYDSELRHEKVNMEHLQKVFLNLCDAAMISVFAKIQGCHYRGFF